MISISNPEDYVPVFAEPVFVVEATVTDSFEVQIVDGEQNALGVKGLGGELSYGVNVANYAKAKMDVCPTDSGECGFVEPSARVVELGLCAGEDFEEYESGLVKVAASRKELVEGRLLSDIPLKRNIAMGERDELSFLLGASDLKATLAMRDGNGIYSMLEDVEYEVEQAGIVSFVLDMDDLEVRVDEQLGGAVGDYEAVVVEISKDDESLVRVEYDIVAVDHKRVRMCWWNQYGMVDYYGFGECGEKKLEVDKQVVSTSDGGCRTECSKIVRSGQVVSGAISRAEARAVEQVLYAPRVWLDEGGEFVDVGVITDIISWAEGELPSVGFEFRRLDTE